MKWLQKKGLLILCSMLLVNGLWAAQQAQTLQLYETVKSGVERHGITLPASSDRIISRIRSWMDEVQAVPGKRTVHLSLEKAGANLILEVVTQDWDGLQWVNETKDVMTFDDQMTEVFSMINQEWVGGTWINSSRMTTKQDGNGRITEMGFDSWRDNQWLPDLLNVFTFDANGNLTTSIMQMDMYGSGQLENQSKSEYTYNAGGQLTHQEDFIWNYGEWAKMFITDYAYNAQGQLIEERLKMDLYGFIMEQGRVLYTYHANGEVETETTQTFDVATQSYVNAEMTTYEYNGDKEVTVELDQIWDGGKWVNQSKWTQTFDGADKQISEWLWQEWQNETWLNIERTIYTYDANGNETESVDQVWENGAWVNVERDQSQYNADGLPVETVTQKWENGAWVNDSRALATYQGSISGVLSEGLTQPDTFSMNNYPNPFNPATTIVFNLTAGDRVSLQILDITGRTVRTLLSEQHHTAGTVEVQWDGLDNFGQAAPSGIYFYHLKGTEIQATGRCLLTK